MGISEYWIVDYAALGGREFIGKPKQPTILIGSLDEGEYQSLEGSRHRLRCITILTMVLKGVLQQAARVVKIYPNRLLKPI